MSAEEIVRGLRDALPPKIDYAALVCAEGFAHGTCYVWDDPLWYIIDHAAALIESLTAQLSASQQRERAARNELCMKCGRYQEAHKGACDGCRWKEI